MAETGNSAIRSLLQKRLIRIPLKLALGLVVFGVIAFAAAAIYNAFDENLSAEAKVLLAPPPMGIIDDKNGFIAFLGMVAPKDRDQMDWGRQAAAAFTAQAQPGFTRSSGWKEATKPHIKIPMSRDLWCKPEVRDCLAEAKRDGAAGILADADNPELLKRYRKTREIPEFADLYIGTSLAAQLPNYPALTAGASLSHADIALKVGAGKFAEAVAELEREVAFHRRLIAGGKSLLAAMHGNRLLSRDLLIISELLRSHGKSIVPFRTRLGVLTWPQSSAAALDPAFRLEAHQWITFAHGVRTLLRGEEGRLPSNDLGENLARLGYWAQSLLARPNETANLVARLAAEEASMTRVPAAQFLSAREEVSSRKKALVELPWYAAIRNPGGRDLGLVGDTNLSRYLVRMHDLLALERLVDLQLTLAARGITAPTAIAAFVAGEGANSHPDPYTGKAFALDPDKRLLSFDVAGKDNDGWAADLKKRRGKVGIEI